MAKNFLQLLLRTFVATLIVGLLYLFSGRLLNILPAILFVPLAIIYIMYSMLLYFSIASDDIASTLLGVAITIVFIITWGINVSYAETIFSKGVYVVGILLGIVQTIKSVSIRLRPNPQRFQ